MFKNFRLAATGVALAAAMGMSGTAYAQASDTADARAEILSALTLTWNNTDLDFGAMVVTGAGVVSLAADSTLTCTDPDVICHGTTTVSGFDITTGSANKGVTINVPTTDVTLLRAGGTAGTASDELELNGFVTSATLNAGNWETTLDASGEGSFTVGGDLNFDGSEVAGVYTGSYTVSVEYS